MIALFKAFILLSITLLTLGINHADAAVDLVETHVSNPPPTATEGRKFWVNDTVQNEGADTAPSSVTRYYLSTTGSKDANSILLSGKRSVTSLKPGKKSVGWAIVTVPLVTPIGIYYLVACADDTGVVNESDETNNCIASAKTVQLTAPDLVETSVTDPPSTASAGDSFSVTDTVENQGNRISLTSVTQYYLSSSGVKDNGAIRLIGKRSVPILAPGRASKGTVTVEIPHTAPEDMYYLLACTDDINKVAEGSEQNNCITSSTQVTLSPPPNVLPVTVNGSLCSADSVDSYLNKPCVSVTICTPDSTTCLTINDILLDTGSSGLRIFKQVLGNVSLPQKMVGVAALAECIQYGDGSSDWGPVAMADIILGNEPAILAPIQIIDATFATRPSPCQNADSSPTEALYSGILGVGLFAQDCGPVCASNSKNGMYYACAGLDCTGTTVSLSDQVPNPVVLLPVDNNGVVVQIPAVPPGGSISVDGQLLLGIGTRSNNMPSAGVISYAANQNTGYFLTNFNRRLLNSFIDTGSNGLFFPTLPGLYDCGSIYGFLFSGWFCPSSPVNLSATNRGAFGSPSGVVSFQIENFYSLISSPHNVFPDIGGDNPGGFDWGLPFHLGRFVYVGIEKKSSALGTGPYWAY